MYVWGVPLVFRWDFGQKRSVFTEGDVLGVEISVLDGRAGDEIGSAVIEGVEVEVVDVLVLRGAK
jgi:hypothetical protein